MNTFVDTGLTTVRPRDISTLYSLQLYEYDLSQITRTHSTSRIQLGVVVHQGREGAAQRVLVVGRPVDEPVGRLGDRPSLLLRVDFMVEQRNGAANMWFESIRLR